MGLAVYSPKQLKLFVQRLNYKFSKLITKLRYCYRIRISDNAFLFSLSLISDAVDDKNILYHVELLWINMNFHHHNEERMDLRFEYSESLQWLQFQVIFCFQRWSQLKRNENDWNLIIQCNRISNNNECPNQVNKICWFLSNFSQFSAKKKIINK